MYRCFLRVKFLWNRKLKRNNFLKNLTMHSNLRFSKRLRRSWTIASRRKRVPYIYIINPLYNPFYCITIFVIDRVAFETRRGREDGKKDSTEIYVNKRNCLISMTIIYLTTITLQIILFLRFNYRPPPNRINSHSLDYHTTETMPQLLLIMNNHVQWIN